jgi:hypothetical protein
MYYAEVVEEGVATNKALEIGIDVDEMAMCPDEDTGGLASVEDNGGEKAIDETAEKENVKDADVTPVDELRYGTTRSGTTFRDIAAVNLAQFPLELTKAERNYYEYMKTCNEITCVGAGVGGGFTNTTELHVMKYDQAMQSQDADQWNKAIEEEYKRMEENDVWIPVAKSEVPHDAKVLTST